MKISFFDKAGKPYFKGGKILIANIDQLENREWAPGQFSNFPKAGGNVTEIPLDTSGACDLSVLQNVAAGMTLLVKDWAGADHLIINFSE